MIAPDKLMFALGLAQKAGKLASGDTAVQLCVRAGKAKMLLLATDASENSRKAMLSLAANNGLYVLSCLSKDQLGQAIGRAHRTAVAVVDKSFSAMIRRQAEQCGQEDKEK